MLNKMIKTFKRIKKSGSSTKKRSRTIHLLHKKAILTYPNPDKIPNLILWRIPDKSLHLVNIEYGLDRILV
jgi:hypothetical protein